MLGFLTRLRGGLFYVLLGMVLAVVKWLEYVRKVLGCVQRKFGVKGFTLPKELTSFMA